MRIARAIVVAAGLAVFGVQGLLAQASVQGQWRTLPLLMPINPVHIAVTYDGKVLIVSGSGNVAAETNFRAAVWNLQAGTIAIQSLVWDMFCNGMVVLHDGRVLVNGGNIQYDPFFGEPRNAVFDPATHGFTNIQNMDIHRWFTFHFHSKQSCNHLQCSRNLCSNTYCN